MNNLSSTNCNINHELLIFSNMLYDMLDVNNVKYMYVYVFVYVII